MFRSLRAPGARRWRLTSSRRSGAIGGPDVGQNGITLADLSDPATHSKMVATILSADDQWGAGGHAAGRINLPWIIPPRCGDRASLLLLSPGWLIVLFSLYSRVLLDRQEARLLALAVGRWTTEIRFPPHRVRHAVSTVTAAMATGRSQERGG